MQNNLLVTIVDNDNNSLNISYWNPEHLEPLYKVQLFTDAYLALSKTTNLAIKCIIRKKNVTRNGAINIYYNGESLSTV